MKRQLIASALAAFGLSLAVGCVHTDVTRTGRMRLGHGSEGSVAVLPQLTPEYAEVATLTVSAQAIDTPARRLRHLVRRASLLGCDAVTNVRNHSDYTTGACVRMRDGIPPAQPEAKIATTSETLMDRAVAAGPQGATLVKALRQAEQPDGTAKAWPLEWYLRQYPNSPFHADVEALFVAPSEALASGATSPASVRTAPVR